MAEMLHSYAFYDGMSYGFPLAFLILIPTALLFILTLYLVSYFCYGNYIWTAAYELLCLVYGEKVQKECEENGKLLKISLYGYKLRHVAIAALSLAVILVHICAFSTFFSELFISESDQCSVHMDCFALNASTRRLAQQSSLQENCSYFLTNSSYLVRCYELSFNYISAIGSTGGVLVVGYFVLKTQAALVAGFLDLGEKNRLCGFVAFLIIELIFQSLMYFIVGLLLGLVDKFSDSAFSSTRSTIQFVIYLLTLFYTFLASLLSFVVLMLTNRPRENAPLVHHAKLVEHAEIVIVADTVQKSDSVGASGVLTFPRVPKAQDEQIRAQRVKKATLVVTAGLVNQSVHVSQSSTVEMTDGVLPRDVPLPDGYSQPRCVEEIDLVIEADKVLYADHIKQADVVLQASQVELARVMAASDEQVHATIKVQSPPNNSRFNQDSLVNAQTNVVRTLLRKEKLEGSLPRIIVEVPSSPDVSVMVVSEDDADNANSNWQLKARPQSMPSRNSLDSDVPFRNSLDPDGDSSKEPLAKKLEIDSQNAIGVNLSSMGNNDVDGEDASPGKRDDNEQTPLRENIMLKSNQSDDVSDANTGAEKIGYQYEEGSGEEEAEMHNKESIKDEELVTEVPDRVSVWNRPYAPDFFAASEWDQDGEDLQTSDYPEMSSSVDNLQTSDVDNAEGSVEF